MRSIQIADDLELRRVDPDDAPALEALARDYDPQPQMNEWVDAETTPQGVARFIESALSRSMRGLGLWAGIWCQGELAGLVGLQIAEGGASVGSIDFLLGPKFRGRGLVSRACGALVQYAFDEVGLDRLEISPDVANRASCAVAERLGFQREGLLRGRLAYPGFRGDQAIYGMLRNEWQSARPSTPASPGNRPAAPESARSSRRADRTGAPPPGPAAKP